MPNRSLTFLLFFNSDFFFKSFNTSLMGSASFLLGGLQKSETDRFQFSILITCCFMGHIYSLGPGLLTGSLDVLIL